MFNLQFLMNRVSFLAAVTQSFLHEPVCMWEGERLVKLQKGCSPNCPIFWVAGN